MLGSFQARVKVNEGGAFQSGCRPTTHSTRARIELLSCARLSCYYILSRRVNSGVRLLNLIIMNMAFIQFKLILIAAVTCMLAWSDTYAQRNLDEPEIVRGDSNSCELNALNLDVLRNMALSEAERIFVIARRGQGERSNLINRRRLQSVREQLIQIRGIPSERIVFAEGDPSSGVGQVEFYVGSKLIFVSLAGDRGELCLSCCGDQPTTSPTRKRRNIRNRKRN